MDRLSRFNVIATAVDQADLEGLLAIGAPRHEYDGEASLIKSRIISAFGKSPLDVKRVEHIVIEVWNEQFGPYDPAELENRRAGFQALARAIVENQ